MIGKWNNFSKEEIENIYAQSNSFIEVAKKFGYRSTNGQLNNKLRLLAKDLGINYFHLEPNQRLDLVVGNIYEGLQYIEDDKDRKHYVICKCLKCGQQTSIYKYNLGKQKTCGCNKTEKFSKTIQLEGCEIGNFKVISLDKELSLQKNKIYWSCRCNFCNGIKSIESYRLRNNPPYSCGCISLNSKGEQKIADVLGKMNISFKREYSFINFFDFIGHPFRFDFAIEFPKLILIEYHGKQHYDKDYGWDESYEEIVKRDKKKEQYCKENGIPLIIIPYTDYDKIDTKYLLNILKGVDKNAEC